MTTPTTPERCGQRLKTLTIEYVCDLTTGHRSEYHLDTSNLVTWSYAGDLEHHANAAQADTRGRPAVEVLASGRVNMAERFAQRPGLGYDACSARLTVHQVGDNYPRTMTWVCWLAPHDANDKHRAADGTQWRATDFPPVAPVDSGVAFKASALLVALESMEARMVELREAVDSGQLDAVRVVLKDAGLGYAPPADDVHDLVTQRDAHAEHAKNCEDALARIAVTARNAIALATDRSEDGRITVRNALVRIVKVAKETDR